MDDDPCLSGPLPRVESLRYAISSVAAERWEVDFDPHERVLGRFRCEVSGSDLLAFPLESVFSEEEARAELEPALRRWEAAMELGMHAPCRFAFAGATVLQPPAEGGEIQRHVVAAWTVNVGARISARVRPQELPEPPLSFAEPADLRLLRERIRDYRLGRDRLLGVANFALTTFWKRYGGKRATPGRMNVEPAVLATLNELSSNRTSDQHGRKALRKPELSRAEQTWVEAVVPALALRMGQVEGAGQTSLLTLADFPPLAHVTS